jgi:hypothetical protein
MGCVIGGTIGLNPDTLFRREPDLAESWYSNVFANEPTIAFPIFD